MFRPMNKREIEIKKISNIRMIQFYEITGIAMKSGLPDGRPAEDGCAALAVYYGNNMQINMNETEPFFNLLVNHVYSLYNGMTDEEKSAVLMNEYTRELLQAGEKPKEKPLFSRYYGLNPSDAPEIPFESTLSKRFAPLAQYIAESVYKVLGFELILNRIKLGWRGQFTMLGLVGEEEVSLTCRVIKETDRFYIISITNFIKKNSSLVINLETDPDYINIVFESAEAGIKGNSRFIFENDKVCETHSITFRGEDVFFENTENKPEPVKKGKIPGLAEEQELLLMQCDSAAYSYKLPWGPLYIRFSEKKSSGETEIEEYINTLILPEAGLSETHGRSEIRNSRTGIRIKTDAFFARKLLLPRGRVQTFFVPQTANSNGKYRELLEGRLFIENGSEKSE